VPLAGKLLNPKLMFLVTIRMKAAPEKRKELAQAVVSLSGVIKSMKGCLRCDLCNSLEDEDEFCLIGEWKSREDLQVHLESELFQVLRGAMSLLTNPHEMSIYNIGSCDDKKHNSKKY
jgi:quinol monooxygenase YgiN